MCAFNNKTTPNNHTTSISTTKQAAESTLKEHEH